MMRVFILIFILFSGMFASEEIGYPTISGYDIIESAVLKSDGKSFYTLQDQDLIHWKLPSLKKLQAWKVPKGVKYNHRDIYFLDDYKKVLMLSKTEFTIYNLETNKIEKQKLIKNFQAKKHKDYIYSFRVFSEIEHRDYPNTYVIYLDMWNVKTLEKVKSVNLSKLSAKDFPPPKPPTYNQGITSIEAKGNVFFAEDVFYYSMENTRGTYVFNTESLTIKKMIPGGPAVFLMQGYMNIRKNVYRTSDASFQKKISHYISKGDVHNLAYLGSSHRRYSVVGDLVLSYNRAGYRFYRITDKKNNLNSISKKGDSSIRIADIGQKDGELTLLGLVPRSADGKRVRLGKIQSSVKDFRLLEMITNRDSRTEKEILIPMNEATYKKYNTNLDIKVIKWEQ